MIARICRLVGGMPLAIELAAGWVDTLTLSDIAAEIEHGLDLLTVEVRNGPARHRSMRAVFDASWWRLGAAERRMLARLSVFRGGGARRAVQRVTAATLPQLQAMVGASLLHYDAECDRYTIHELLRQYAAERLAADPEDERAVRDRHAACYCTLLRDVRADLRGARQREALHALEAVSTAARYLGRGAESERLAQEGYNLAVGMDNRLAIARAASNLGMAVNWSGNYHEAHWLLGQAVRLYTTV